MAFFIRFLMQFSTNQTVAQNNIILYLYIHTHKHTPNQKYVQAFDLMETMKNQLGKLLMIPLSTN